MAILGRGQTKITEGVAALDGGSVVSKGAWDGVLYFGIYRGVLRSRFVSICQSGKRMT